VPAVAQAHVSLHPNAIPAGSFATTNIRVPNEEAHASTTSVGRRADRRRLALILGAVALAASRRKDA
jgi:hypothetical protein